MGKWFNQLWWGMVVLWVATIIGLICYVGYKAGGVEDRWVWKTVFCDHLVWNNWKGTVREVYKWMVYLDDVEVQCQINCEQWWLEYWARYKTNDDYYKLNEKKDCYIEWDIQSLYNYMHR